MRLYIWWFLCAMNLIAFILMGLDKEFAKRNQMRFPETALLTVAACGGSLMTLLAMYLFHHKTRKPKFFICVPCFLVLHIALLIFLYPHI